MVNSLAGCIEVYVGVRRVSSQCPIYYLGILWINWPIGCLFSFGISDVSLDCSIKTGQNFSQIAQWFFLVVDTWQRGQPSTGQDRPSAARQFGYLTICKPCNDQRGDAKIPNKGDMLNFSLSCHLYHSQIFTEPTS